MVWVYLYEMHFSDNGNLWLGIVQYISLPFFIYVLIMDYASELQQDSHTLSRREM